MSSGLGPTHILPLSLQPPAEDKVNGILLGFRIRYRELLYEGLRGFTLRGINNPGAKWAELTCEWHPEGGGSLSPCSGARSSLKPPSLQPWLPPPVPGPVRSPTR